jgi:predicted AlkP superfamily pyrophosphatase or phosphodiesterase
MLNLASVTTVNGSKFSQRFVKPRYDSYCFANIPQTIAHLLTGQGENPLPSDVFGTLPQKYDKVVFFFIDAFGWKLFERHAEKFAFLKTILADGVVSKLTSQFPSTTAAHITCIHTGLNVGQSGVYEWSYYEPLVGEVISPLLFSFAGDKHARDTIKRAGIPAVAFFPQQTFYENLRAQGIKSHILQYQAYTPSTYSNIVFRGAQVHPYTNLQDALEQMTYLLTQPNSTPGYYFLYFDRIDITSHHHGPYAYQTDEAIYTFFTLLQNIFYQNVRGKSGETLFIMSSDHGQVEVNPRLTYYLNRRITHIEQYLKTGKRGRPLVPAGSARDMFLYVKEEYEQQAIFELQQQLAGQAEVYRTQELIEQNFFGLQLPSDTFMGRVGNIVILPYKHETVWWYEEGKFDMHFHGHHGGLTAEEMEIPFLVLPLS